jgi:hypothetical protein
MNFNRVANRCAGAAEKMAKLAHVVEAYVDDCLIAYLPVTFEVSGVVWIQASSFISLSNDSLLTFFTS